jgi:PRC-barrel domain
MPRPARTALLSLGLAASGIALALAQTTPPQPAPTPSPGTTTRSPLQSQHPKWRTPRGDEIRASKLIGAPVLNGAGEAIGNISEVVLGKDGRVGGIVLGVGGFLGLGERQVAAGFESLQLGRDNGGRMILTLNVTKDALMAAPEWKWRAEERGRPTGTDTKPLR